MCDTRQSHYMALAPLRIICLLSCDRCKYSVGDALARFLFRDSDRYLAESVHLSAACHVQMPLIACSNLPLCLHQNINWFPQASFSPSDTSKNVLLLSKRLLDHQAPRVVITESLSPPDPWRNPSTSSKRLLIVSQP